MEIFTIVFANVVYLDLMANYCLIIMKITHFIVYGFIASLIDRMEIKLSLAAIPEIQYYFFTLSSKWAKLYPLT